MAASSKSRLSRRSASSSLASATMTTTSGESPSVRWSARRGRLYGHRPDGESGAGVDLIRPGNIEAGYARTAISCGRSLGKQGRTLSVRPYRCSSWQRDCDRLLPIYEPPTAGMSRVLPLLAGSLVRRTSPNVERARITPVVDRSRRRLTGYAGQAEKIPGKVSRHRVTEVILAEGAWGLSVLRYKSAPTSTAREVEETAALPSPERHVLGHTVRGVRRLRRGSPRAQ